MSKYFSSFNCKISGSTAVPMQLFAQYTQNVYTTLVSELTQLGIEENKSSINNG